MRKLTPDDLVNALSFYCGTGVETDTLMVIHQALGLREEWRIEWDGEPKMGGGCHTMSVGITFPAREQANTVAKATRIHLRPGFRLAHRLATDWSH